MMSLEKCRTCYNDMEPETLIRLDTIDLLHSISIGTKLSQCIPELELNTMKEKICKSCLNITATVYNFRKMCLQTEATLKSKNFEANNTSIKSEPSEVFIPLSIVKTEMNSEEHVVHEHVIHDLTGEEITSRSNSSSELDNLHAFGGDVITGDISVGFEITNAKQIHNTVSVSFTTNSEKSCIFQAEKRSDFESNIQCKPVQLDHRTDTVEAQSHIELDANVQCNPGLSDKEIAANFLKTRPSLRRKNILNANIKLNKLRKSVLLALTRCNHQVYICDYCDDVLVNRARLHKHKARHIRQFQYAEFGNLEPPRKQQKKKSHHSPSHPPCQEKKIKIEFDENLIPFSDITIEKAAAQSPALSRLSLPLGAENGKPQTSLFIVSSPTKKSDSKTKGDGRDSGQFNDANLKPRQDKSPVNKQILTPIKTEPLELSEMEMKCEFCDISFSSSNMFNLHMSLHPDENKLAKKHVCEICKASFGLRVQLNGHLSMHSSKRSARNKTRQLKVITSKKAETSQFKAKPPKIQQFDNKVSPTMNKAKPPKIQQSDNKVSPTLNKAKPPKIQQLDNKVSPTLNKTIINLKNNKTSNPSNETISTVVDCVKCGKKFDNVYHYNVHSCLKTNEAQKMLKCEVCQKYFLGRNTFLEHVKSHLNGHT